MWKREAFEALDLVHSEVGQHFDQERIQVAAQREQAVIESAHGKEGSRKLTLFVAEWLSLELAMLGDMCKRQEVTTIQDVVSIL